MPLYGLYIVHAELNSARNLSSYAAHFTIYSLAAETRTIVSLKIIKSNISNFCFELSSTFLRELEAGSFQLCSRISEITGQVFCVACSRLFHNKKCFVSFTVLSLFRAAVGWMMLSWTHWIVLPKSEKSSIPFCLLLHAVTFVLSGIRMMKSWQLGFSHREQVDKSPWSSQHAVRPIWKNSRWLEHNYITALVS